MAKPFISARIPEDLLEQLESHVTATGESKTEILVEALTEYLNPHSSNTESNQSLERQMRHFEHWLMEKVGRLENKVNALESSKGFLTATGSLEGRGTRSLTSTPEKRQPQLPPGNDPIYSC